MSPPPAVDGAAAASAEAALERRRQVYARGLYAKHMAANEWTGYARAITPLDFDGISSRAQTFLERELRIWTGDAVALARHIVHLLSAVDVRSDAAVLLLEPLVGDAAAQHLAHELYAFLRSQRGLQDWDELVQYDDVAAEPLPEVVRGGGGMSRRGSYSPSPRSDRSPSRSRSPSPSRSRSRSYETRPRPRLPPKQWHEADSWVDPEYAAELRRRRRGQARSHGARDREDKPSGSERGRELLGREPPRPSLSAGTFAQAAADSGIVIRGAAERRESLLERLAAAKGERSASNGNGNGHGEEASVPPPNRAQELRERLLAEKKRKVLREQLMARKRDKARGDGEVEPEVAEPTPQA